jgi:hypothetical protein
MERQLGDRLEKASMDNVLRLLQKGWWNWAEDRKEIT